MFIFFDFDVLEAVKGIVFAVDGVNIVIGIIFLRIHIICDFVDGIVEFVQDFVLGVAEKHLRWVLVFRVVYTIRGHSNLVVVEI